MQTHNKFFNDNNIYLPDYINELYLQNDGIKDDLKIIHEYLKYSTVQQEFIIKLGIFKAIYTCDKGYPHNLFGYGVSKNITVNFFENDILLFSKIANNIKSIILHGDGKIKSNTFFTINESKKDTLSVYDFENTHIRDVLIGADRFCEFVKVNDRYAIGMTEEYCCHTPFTGLFNLDILFDKHQEKYDVLPYDKSRIHVPLSKESTDCDISMSPLIATPKGFIVKINKPVSYKFTEDNLVTYDDVFNEVADFYEGIESVDPLDIFNILNLSENQQNETIQALNKGNSVNISFDKLSYKEKSNIFDKISSQQSIT